MIISGSFLRRMRNIPDKCCRENESHILCSAIFSNIALFMRYCGKLWYSQTSHRWPYGPCAWHADNYGYNTNLDYIILFAFPQQQWLHEPSSLFHNTTLPVLFSLNLYGTLKLITMQEHWLYLLTCIFNLWEYVLNSDDEYDNSVCSRTLLGR